VDVTAELSMPYVAALNAHDFEGFSPVVEPAGSISLTLADAFVTSAERGRAFYKTAAQKNTPVAVVSRSMHMLCDE